MVPDELPAPAATAWHLSDCLEGLADWKGTTLRHLTASRTALEVGTWVCPFSGGMLARYSSRPDC